MADLKDVLQPFADLADWIDENRPEYADPAMEVQIENWPYTLGVGWLYAARDALRTTPPADPAPTADAVERARQIVIDNTNLPPDAVRIGQFDQHVTMLCTLAALQPRAVPDGGGATAHDDLARLIETRLLGVAPDDQDLVLEDHDWRCIIAALAAQPRAVVGDAVRKAAQRVIDTRNANGAWNLDPDLDALEAALDAEPAVVGDVVTVPREPTREMWAAGGNAVVGYKQRHHDKVVKDIWSAMLAAASSPASGGE